MENYINIFFRKLKTINIKQSTKMNQSIRINTSKCNGYESLMAILKKLSKEELDYQKENNKKISRDYQFKKYHERRNETN